MTVVNIVNVVNVGRRQEFRVVCLAGRQIERQARAEIGEADCELQVVAKREGRTLSQLCEILLAGGSENYKKGSKCIQRMLSHYKKESPQ